MRASFALLVFSAVVPSCLLGDQASDFSDFKMCLTSASGAQWNASTQTCTLPYYSTPYMVGSTIPITSSSIRYISTGNGGVASTSPQATLKRDVSSANPSSPFAILSADSSANNLLIESLVIHGSRADLNGQGSAVLKCLPSGNPSWIDVDLGGAGYTPGTAYSGVNLYDMTFQDSPGFSVSLGPWSYVYWSWFYRPRITAIFTNANDVINDNVFENSGTGAVSVANNVTVEYNQFTSNHDEWTYANPGGQVFIGQNAATNFTILSNTFNGGNLTCSATGCNAGPYSCPVGATGNILGTNGIEAWSPGGTYNNNEITNQSGSALFIAGVNGAPYSVPSVTLLNNDPSWPTGYIENNLVEGVLIQNGGLSVGGAFSFTALHSRNNGTYGFRWIGTVDAGTTLSWGSGNSACLTGNSTGYSIDPPGLSGPSSTATCP